MTTNWPSMNTAPKDGRKVVLWIGGDCAPVCSWELYEGGNEDGIGGAYAWWRHDTDDWLDYNQPTGWMPVPEDKAA